MEAMKGLGLKDDLLLEAGLLHKRDDGSLVPRFRGRLLFPIHDLRAASWRSADASWAKASPST